MINNTTHKVFIGQAQSLKPIPNSSIHLVVTSPPYPMIEMWDKIMARQNAEIEAAAKDLNGPLMFELMHKELDKVWRELERVVMPGGIVCINIGDATRTINESFALYPNHSRIIAAFLQLGFVNLPNILWRKQTNAPTKFMGSGMLSPGAYVTLEHEWVLIFRKGGKREFKTEPEKNNRRESAFFWEERNVWFSDVWDLKGTRQFLPNAETRERTAAYPFAMPYRLINMFSVKGDTVLDPFLGTGTTSIAAIAAQRNSIGVDIDDAFKKIATNRIEEVSINEINSLIDARIDEHAKFVSNEKQNRRHFKHFNKQLNIEVMTSQEVLLNFHHLSSVQKIEEGNFNATYMERTSSHSDNTPKRIKQAEPTNTL
jgi:modification methylase